MSYLAQQLVGFNLNSPPQDFHANDQMTPSPSPTSPSLNLAINSSSSLLKRRLQVPTTPPGDEDKYQEPVTKKISLRHDEELQRMQRQREDIQYALSGFSKISLPDVSTTSTHLYPPPNNGIRRTVLDGGYFLNQEDSSFGYNRVVGTRNEAAPSQTKAEGGSSRSARSKSSLPPLPPPLRRTLSEPSPATKELFPKCTVDGDGCVSEQSPNKKRLEKMKLGLREMSERWAQLLREADGVADQKVPTSYCDSSPVMKLGIHLPLESLEAVPVPVPVPGGMTEEEEGITETEETTQEAVSVEILGECLSINFSCPCNKGYQILLSGKSCYYKLV